MKKSSLLYIGIGVLAILLLVALLYNGESSDFPAKITTGKRKEHVRVIGTKVFLVVPKEFQYVRELARYKKNDELGVQVVELTESGFLQTKSQMTRKAIKSRGARLDAYKEVKFNGYEGIYTEGSAGKPGMNMLCLTFGDEGFTVSLLGYYREDDLKGKKQLQNILRTAYYEKNLEVDPMELVNFEFDQTITGFKYASRASGVFFYCQNGKFDIQNPFANTIQITGLPKMSDSEVKAYSTDLIRKHEQAGVMITSKKWIKTKVAGYNAYVLETRMKFKNNSGKLYLVLLLGDKSSVLFSGSTYRTEGDFDKLKRTAETVKIK